jgi:hypothetical protein
MGGTLLALSDEIDQGVLNVPGGVYSLMLPRSTDFTSLHAILNANYPPPRDQQLLLTALQSYWDYSDPVTFAPHQLTNMLMSPSGTQMPPRQLVMQEGIGDVQVANVATRVVVRTMGLPYIGTPTENVYDVTTIAGPATAGYTQWNLDPNPPPTGFNTPTSMDNNTHEGVRALPKVIQQIQTFLQPGGQIVDDCAGPCHFPMPN